MNKLTIIGFASTRSVQIAARIRRKGHSQGRFASTRSVQIAAHDAADAKKALNLCLHTLRADCSPVTHAESVTHALCLHTLRADCSHTIDEKIISALLCLHTLRADCSAVFRTFHAVPLLCLHTLRADCSGRNAQNAYALFRTCVELVDSFSVLNKSMLR